MAVIGVNPRFVVLIQGKPFVTFAGLLALAHQRGLQLRVQWTYNDAELSLAAPPPPLRLARSRNAAMPRRVMSPRKWRPISGAWRVPALQPRALRLALGVETCSLEELGAGRVRAADGPPAPQRNMGHAGERKSHGCDPQRHSSACA